VPYLDRDRTSIYFEERGAGPPLLLIAPGGMRSGIEYWKAAAVNPWDSYADDFRLIAMDQRNAGRSRGPLDLTDPWGSYAADQLALLDSLGVERFLVLGCCIGCSYILKLIEVAPQRVLAAVLEQPIGVDESNRQLFEQMQDSWAEELVDGRSDVDAGAASKFLASMWKDDFVVSVGRHFLGSIEVPFLVLPGVDDYHPTITGREVAALVRGAEVLEPWKDTPEHAASATEAARQFLLRHVERAG
jgi:pimeloyl-ACP methyl ester carboxylesterase